MILPDSPVPPMLTLTKPTRGPGTHGIRLTSEPSTGIFDEGAREKRVNTPQYCT